MQRAIAKKGTKPHPYLQRTLSDVDGEVLDDFNRGMNRIIEKILWKEKYAVHNQRYQELTGASIKNPQANRERDRNPGGGRFELSDIRGLPSIRVLPDDVDNETETNRSDERMAKFTLLTHIEMTETPESEEEAYNTMYDLQDLIMDKLQEYDWENLVNVLQTQVTYGGYELLEMNNGINLVFRMTVTVKYSRKV